MLEWTIKLKWPEWKLTITETEFISGTEITPNWRHGGTTRRTSDFQRTRLPVWARLRNNSGQVVQFTTCLSSRQYNLVPANGRRCSATGKVTAGLAENNGSLSPGLWFRSPAGWLPGPGSAPEIWNRSWWVWDLPIPSQCHQRQAVRVVTQYAPARCTLGPSCSPSLTPAAPCFQ